MFKRSILSKTSIPTTLLIRSASTYSHQSTLPRLHVANLALACHKYLRSVQPLLTPEEYQKTAKLANDFATKDGIELHAKLQEYAKDKPNWLEKWWDLGVYLGYQDPLPFRSNFYFQLVSQKPKLSTGTDAQTIRAASLLHGCLKFHHQLQKSEVEPQVVKGVAYDMSQFARLFGHVRVPGQTYDKMHCFVPQPESLPTRHFDTVYHSGLPRHVIVLRKGRFFSFEVTKSDGSPLPLSQIEAGLSKIKKTADSLGENHESIGYFTTLDRGVWGRHYPKLHELNKAAIDKLNSGLWVVCLDEGSKDWTDSVYSSNFFHGVGSNVGNRFYDKHQLIVCEDGKSGFNIEHAPGDGLTSLRLSEFVIENEKSISQSEIDQQGSNQFEINELEFKLSSDLKEAFSDAKKKHLEHISRTKTRVVRYEGFGSNNLKAAKFPPDAFAQMIKQLAFYKQFGLTASTYESGSTRTFLHGRTETIRTASPESHQFVSSMDIPLFSDKRKKKFQLSLLQNACQAHVQTTKDAVAGNGCDRVFLGMRFLAKEQGIPMPEIFNDPAFWIGNAWRLSTSNCGSSALSIFGFGNVANDGYGLGYFIENNSIVWNVTSDGDEVNANDFGELLIQSAKEMQFLAENQDKF